MESEERLTGSVLHQIEMGFPQIKLREKNQKVEQNGALNRRHYGNEERVEIMREHLENQVPLK